MKGKFGQGNRLINITGQRFGRLLIVGREPMKPGAVGKEKARWLALCDCGTLVRVDGSEVKRKIISCGCAKRERAAGLKLDHGQHNTPTYNCWVSMKSRCFGTNPASRDYAVYHQRGITVCDRWANSFPAFLADMGEKPSAAHSIDRTNNDGNYEPGNCRWATNREQQLNKRTNRVVTIDGVTKSISEWADVSPVHYESIRRRLTDGWEPKCAIFAPPMRRRSQQRGSSTGQLVAEPIRKGER